MKAIITDLDRTLLRTDKSISDYTLRILQKCRERGILLLSASARPARDMLRFQEMLSLDAFAASCGAVIMLPDAKTEFGIPAAGGEKILQKLMQFPDVFLSIETSKGLYSNRDIPLWQPVVYDRFPALPEGIILYKILVSSESSTLYENIESALTPDVYYTLAGESLLQIMSTSATKWQGIRHMLKHFGISPADAVYFGDDNDDILPIKNCGLGVAVSNAIPAVLSAADQITGSNDADGVAAFIEKHIL